MLNNNNKTSTTAHHFGLNLHVKYILNMYAEFRTHIHTQTHRVVLYPRLHSNKRVGTEFEGKFEPNSK